MTTQFETKLARFLKTLEDQRNEDTERRYPILHKTAIDDGRRGYHEVGSDPGKRFVRVWDSHGSKTSKSVSYFVEIETGIIFGAKSWRIYNPNHEYGTLDTIDEWDWSGFYATHKEGRSRMFPKSIRR